ncbi:putative membrane protein [Pseudomonas syringae]|nr:putative membrane protein [Pseudomonas syringae]
MSAINIAGSALPFSDTGIADHCDSHSTWDSHPAPPSVTKPLFSSSPKVIAMHQTGFTAFTFIVSVLFSRTRKWASFYSLGPAF